MSTFKPLPVLEVKELSVDYAAANGTVHAVDNVSLSLARGEVLGLAGESGSGKSTLAYAISRLLRPPALITHGEVLYYPPTDHEADSDKHTYISDIGSEAVDVLKLSPKRLRSFRWNEMAIVFQSAMNALNPVLRLDAQIYDVLKAHSPHMTKEAIHERGRELMRLVGIAPDRLRSYPHELSGGMRQRAIIAIAMALSPEVIIMDEPTTALDVVVQRDILTELLQLKERFHFSIIFITHDLSLLLETANKVAVMYGGKIIEEATSEDIMNRPRHPYTYGLLNSFPSLRGERRKMTGIPGYPPDLRALPTGCAFNPRCQFSFSACTQVVPKLLVPSREFPEQIAACHLYDRQLNPAEPPDQLSTAVTPTIQPSLAKNSSYNQSEKTIPTTTGAPEKGRLS